MRAISIKQLSVVYAAFVLVLVLSLLSTKVYDDINARDHKNKIMVEEPPWEMSSVKKKDNYGNNNNILPLNFESKTMTFCVYWKINSDDWWIHHPDWTVSMQNQTHYCFSLIKDPAKRTFYRRLYKLNHADHACRHLGVVKLLSKGWGADLSVVMDGLLQAFLRDQPAPRVHAETPWHYAAKKDGSSPVCSRMDLSCYFLNISSACQINDDNPSSGGTIMAPNTNNYSQAKLISPPSFYAGTEPTQKNSETLQQLWWWIYEYATRPQTWLRHEVYKRVLAVNMQVPCGVMHVRRGDVILERGGWKRQYYDLKEYIRAMNDRNGNGTHAKNVLLLTDDENAIKETVNTSGYNWMYIDRPRFKGDEGGYENQIPSNNPKEEVVSLLAAFQLVRGCNLLVHTKSHFADYLYHEMKDAYSGNSSSVERINLDHRAH